MIRSMTGYGEGSSQKDAIAINARAKSVNARFLDIRLNIPDILAELEVDIANTVKKSVARGTISITLELIPADKTDLYEISIDEKLLQGYISALESAVDLSDKFSPRDIIALPNVLSSRPKKDVAVRLSGEIKKAVTNAMNSLVQMREREGASIEIDFLERLDRISLFVKDLESGKDLCRGKYFESLRERICKTIEEQIEISEERILQEAAILSSKSDPTEELTRLESHIAQFRETLKDNKPIGSKLKFLLQECNREADTIGAKGSDLETSNSVIAIKEELERIREQLANVE